MGKLTIKDGKKKCTKCKTIKDVLLFSFIKDDRFGKKYISSKCRECVKLQTYSWRSRNPDKNKAIARRSRDKLKEEVYSHYGVGGKTACVICGFDDIRALCIDHINNNGAEERRSLGSKYFAGAIFHRSLKRKNYPPGYQILCANCNQIKELKRRRNED